MAFLYVHFISDKLSKSDRIVNGKQMSLKQIISLGLYTFIVAIITWYVTVEFSLVREVSKTEATNLPAVVRTDDIDLQNESFIVVNDPNLSALSERTDQLTPSTNQSSAVKESKLNQDLQHLSRSYNELSASTEQLKARITVYEQLLNENEITFNVPQPTKLDLEVVNDHLPGDFVSLTDRWGSDKKARFNALIAESKDESWAFDMEHQINDFIMLHEHGQNVRLSKVNCKQSMCEMYGYYTDNALFQLLTHDLLVQPWLMATNTQSNSGDAEGDQMKFYTLMTF